MEEKQEFSIIRVLVVVLALFVVALYLIPHRCPSKKQARRIICNAQMKGLVLYYLTYFDENHSYPPFDTWCDALTPYVGTEYIKKFQCLSDEIGPCSYAINENIPSDAETLPDDFVLFFESAPGWNQVGGVDDVVVDRHDKSGANIAFADGHAEFVAAEDIPKLRWTIEDKSTERK